MKTVAMLVCLLALVPPFSKATNYMSLKGYARWQGHVQTQRWAPR